MTRKQLLDKQSGEITRHLALRFWKLPDGVHYRPRVAFHSRWTAIEVLEHALTNRRGKNKALDSVDDYIQADLGMFYADLDGRFDHLPLSLAHAPKIMGLLMPEMLQEELRQWVDESSIIETGLENSIMQDWLCELNGLSKKQLTLCRRHACLVIDDKAAESDYMYLIELPLWLRQVNELVLLDWRPGGLRNVRQLREHLIRVIQNSTCNTGNCLYRS